jgi:hypothetical protein
MPRSQGNPVKHIAASTDDANAQPLGCRLDLAPRFTGQKNFHDLAGACLQFFQNGIDAKNDVLFGVHGSTRPPAEVVLQ